MIVYKFRDGNCGKTIVTDNIGDISDWLRDSLDPKYNNVCHMTVQVSEEGDDYMETIPEFEGC